MAVKDNDRPSRPEEVKLFRTVADISPELWQDAEARPKEAIISSCGVRFEPDNGFVIPYMGGNYLVDLKNRSVTAPPDHRPACFQKAMVLLNYLSHGQDIGLSGRMIPARELNGGDLFFTGPHSLLTEPVTSKFGRDPEPFLEKAGALGFGYENQGTGYACRGIVLPNIAIGCVLHPADDEFEAELTYTFDSYTHYHLPLDSIWGMINVLAEELTA